MFSFLYVSCLLGWLVVPAASKNGDDARGNTCISERNVLSFLDGAAADYFPKANGGIDLFPMATCNGVRIEEASIDDLQSALEDGQLTSVQLLWCYLERIHQVDEYLQYSPHLENGTVLNLSLHIG